MLIAVNSPLWRSFEAHKTCQNSAYWASLYRIALIVSLSR